MSENLIFIVHWSYDRYCGIDNKPYFHIDTEEVFESDSVGNFFKYLRLVMKKRRLGKNEVKSIQLVKKMGGNLKHLL